MIHFDVQLGRDLGRFLERLVEGIGNQLRWIRLDTVSEVSIMIWVTDTVGYCIYEQDIDYGNGGVRYTFSSSAILIE